ncbi:MAG: kinase-like domain-containing protein [Linnemannia gamsii]|nr:MAG: kinase-like domain-containing protein [Linnemannia gamsii]
MAQRQYPPIFVDPSTNDEYRILQQLSLSISSAVFKAVGPQGDVALKAWFPGNFKLFATDNKKKRKFQQHRSLRTRVLSLRADFQHEEYFCQVLPLCAKQSIRDVVRTRNGEMFSEPEVGEILQQVAVVLAAMHGMDLVHGNIQSSNILWDRGNRVLVNDFCLVQRCKDSIGGFKGGNLNYMPPERIIFPHRYGKPADAWAFGILMFEMLVGRLPERNDETQEVEFGNDLEGLSGNSTKLIRRLLSPNPYRRLDFKEILQHPFIRSQERDQGIEKLKKVQESQQEVSQVTDSTTQSQADTAASTPAASTPAVSALAVSALAASALAASDELIAEELTVVELTAEELIAFLITPTGDLNQ